MMQWSSIFWCSTPIVPNQTTHKSTTYPKPNIPKKKMSKSSDMVVTASAVLALSTLIALYLPPLLSPLPLSIDSHNLLHLSENISLPSSFGPESLAFDPSGVGPYTGVADGTILKWDSSSSSWLPFAFTSSSRKECTRPFAPELEHICGRPLGLRFEQKSGDLYIADAYLGLHKVGSEGGLASLVVDEAEGEPFYFTNDMDIDEDEDIIYFTDSSTKLRRRHFMHSILSGDKTGRFIKYNKLTKQTTVLVRDLAFANGVALSQDRSFVLIAETGACRILRLWLKGPNAGRLDTFIELPGYPDNVRRNQNGEFWVAIHAKKTVLADWMLRNVWFRNALIKVPPSVVQKLHALFVGGHHAIAVKLSEQGQVIKVLEDAQGKKVRYASEVDERNGKLWIGSVMMPSIWVYNLDQ